MPVPRRSVSRRWLRSRSPEWRPGAVAKSALGRLGTADELAELVAWLASERCSFSAGAVFDLLGGLATY